MVSFHDGQLLPHPPDLRQKAGNLKPMWAFSPASRVPCCKDWPSKFKATSGFIYTTVVGQPVNPYREAASETKANNNKQPSRRDWNPLSALQRVFFCMPVSPSPTPIKSLSSTADFCLLLLTVFKISQMPPVETVSCFLII